ncbi:unnamed protein product [Tenebrio molitor]|nr:unnamed protein product [Tenebrio molitor]
MAAEQASSSLLPAKSRSRYDKAHVDFVEWQHKKNVKTINEQVILAYVQELSQSFAPSSLWTIVSMLKAFLQIKEKNHISHTYRDKESKVLMKISLNSWKKQMIKYIY